MSSAPIYGPYHPSSNSISANERLLSDIRAHAAVIDTPASRVDTSVRRRANFQQGRALEILSHAVEYLTDSHMYGIEEPVTPADSEATLILMSLSRSVFSECPEVVSLTQRLRRWISNRLTVRIS